MQLQEAQLQKRIKVWEAVDLWASLYRKTVDGDRLLEQLGLADKRNAWFMTLSGGQKQRLFIALALINDPEVVFLDELTTGLDPQARRAIWELIRGIRDRGKTVFLTTHLMEEAERLCDRVAIIEHGRIVDVDRPARLVDRHCPERSVVLVTTDAAAHERLRAIPHVNDVTREDDRITVRGRGDDLVAEVITCLSEHRIRVTDFRTEHAEPRRRVPEADRPLDPRLSDMNPMRGLLKLTWLEIKIFLREPLGAFGTIAMPVIAFVVLGRIAGGSLARPVSGVAGRHARGASASRSSRRCSSRISAVLSLVTIISIYREGGILKRLRATPLRPLTILTAHVLVKLLLTATTLALMVAGGQALLPGGRRRAAGRLHARAAHQHAEHPVARLPDREHRADGALRAADRRDHPLPDDRRLGPLRADRLAAARCCGASRGSCRSPTPYRCCRASGRTSRGPLTWATSRPSPLAFVVFTAISTKVFRWE